MVRKKVSIIGSGTVGAQTAFLGIIKDLADFVLVDIVDGLPQGKSLDILESAPVFNSDCKIIGTNDYADTKDSDVVVITAGLPRKPGMNREDLIKVNKKIVTHVVKEVTKYSPNCILIIVTNPLDVMCYLAKEVSGFPRERVLGMAGVLDSIRFKAFISEKLNSQNIEAMVLGGHGDSMVPLIKSSTVDGVPLPDVLGKEDIENIIERTRKAGGEIINLIKIGSTCFAPAASIMEMVESIILNKRKLLPCSIYLEGEYGYSDLFLGVPVILGANGAEKIIELNLYEEEKIALDNTAKITHSTISILKSLDSKFSKKADNIKPSATLSFNAKAKELKDQGKDITMFTTGQPDLLPPLALELGLKKAIENHKYKYTAVLGEKKLREQVANYLNKYGTNYTWENVAITHGGKGALSNLLAALVSEDDEVIIPRIRWVSYEDQVALVGGVPVFAEINDLFKITTESLKAAITDKTKMVILNSPSNPTGNIFSREELIELAVILKEKKIYVLSDEIYSEIVYEGEHVSIASLLPEQTFVVNGASKSLVIPGLRIGYLAGDKEIIKKMASLQGANAGNPDSLAQEGLMAAYSTDLTNYFKDNLEQFRKKRDLMYNGLKQLFYNGKPAFEVQLPEGSFYIWANVKNLKPDFGNTSEEVAIKLLEEAGIGCTPGGAFGDDDYIRFSFALSLEEIETGIIKIKKYLESN